MEKEDSTLLMDMLMVLVLMGDFSENLFRNDGNDTTNALDARVQRSLGD